MALLFSYGTLQLPSVQDAVFGRLLQGEPDAIVGHVLDEVVITNPAVLAASGLSVHPVLARSDAEDAEVTGTVFDLDDAEVAAADDYEVQAYARQAYRLRSGRTAWVYVLAE
ncbi:gamma-glutamylcyclotransferase [uncultured Friedmanniella sp.]|uniref:gamma-glutamylcyclotransferase n=1 Tax=uncultured Friedmanniella sp. TaxID=335381 RepID=UPI0035C95BE6